MHRRTKRQFVQVTNSTRHEKDSQDCTPPWSSNVDILFFKRHNFERQKLGTWPSEVSWSVYHILDATRMLSSGTLPRSVWLTLNRRREGRTEAIRSPCMNGDRDFRPFLIGEIIWLNVALLGFWSSKDFVANPRCSYAWFSPFLSKYFIPVLRMIPNCWLYRARKADWAVRICMQGFRFSSNQNATSL